VRHGLHQITDCRFQKFVGQDQRLHRIASVEDGDDYIIAAWAFIPADNMQARADRDGVPYPRWAKEGWIIPTPGNVIDYRTIEAHIRGLCERFDVQEITFDPAYAAPGHRSPMTASRHPRCARAGSLNRPHSTSSSVQ
jgi:phage terminase large subunit-like protein